MPPAPPPRTVLGMDRSTAFSVMFEVVLPALGFALVLGASLLPALAVAVAAPAAIVAVMHVVSPYHAAAVPSDAEVSRSAAQTY